MRALVKVILILWILASSFGLKAEEIALFNKDGEAVAYIDGTDEDLTIYMWDGTPVAYLVADGDDFNVYGFNGKHLGWYTEGVLIDHDGFTIGFIKGALNRYTKHEPYKPMKKFKPFKSHEQLAPYKPFQKVEFSTEPLSLFLIRGAN